MKWLNCEKKKIFLFVFLAAIVLEGDSAHADFTFGQITNLGPNVNSIYSEGGLTITSDGLSIIFSSDRPSGGEWNLYMATRDTTEDEWEPAVQLGLNPPYSQSHPSISKDGLELFYTAPYWQSSWTEYGGADIWVSRRSSVSSEWSEPENLGSIVNTTSHDTEPSISANGLELYFSSDRPGGYGDWNIWMTRRETKDDSWQEPINLGPTVNSGSECHPHISPDSLILFFGSSRPGSYSNCDLWFTRRQTKTDPWQEPINLGSLINSGHTQASPCISSDGSTLYFASTLRPGGITSRGDLWQAPIILIIDFNSDEFVDIDDLLIMIDNWGTDEPLCDIGPMPWGDGVVDEADLEVLMNYWGQRSPKFQGLLMTYWKLDETEGNVAYDSISENHGTIYGEPIWQPQGGIIDGALEFDGSNDYISTPLVFRSDVVPFSLFAWVKGGAPGEVIFSQANRSDWLAADTADGSMMTELRFLTQPAISLQSQSVITDGNWHRVGLVWDGSNRILYVDDIEVASDTYGAGLFLGDLQIGAGNKLEAGTFWSGLIDDVRIYNRAITP